MRITVWPLEAIIVERALVGDQKAFEHLVRRHIATAQAIAMTYVRNREDAEDATQEAFLKAYEQLSSLRDPGRFAAWLVSIVRNVAITAARKRTDAVQLPPEYAFNRPLPDELKTDVRVDALHRHLEQIDIESREVLMLYYFAHKSAREIAEVLGIQLEAAKKRVQRARERLGERVMEELRRDEEEDSKRLAPLSDQIMMAVAALPLPEGSTVRQSAKASVGQRAVLRPLIIAAPALAVLAVIAWFFQPFQHMYVTSRLVQKADPASNGIASQLAGGVPDASSAASANGPDEHDVIEFPQRSLNGVPASVTRVIDGRFDEDNPVKASPPKHEIGPGAIRGIVVWMDGAAASNTRVTATRKSFNPYSVPGTSSDTSETTTDGEGQFEIRDLPLDVFLVRAIADSASSLRTSALRADTPEAEIMMELEPTGTISGVVVSKEGTPVSGARVYPYFTARENRLWRIDWSALHATLTDEYGRFEVGHLWAEGGWKLATQAKGYATTVSELVPVPTRDLRIEIESGDRIEGVVTCAQDGCSLGGMLVHAQSAEMARDHLTAYTGSDGRFAIEGAKSEINYELKVDATSPLVQADAVVTSPRHETVEVPLEMGGVVLGRVVEKSSGEGLIGAQVQAMPPYRDADSDVTKSTLTDAQGTFELAGLRPGEYLLTARFPDHSQTSGFSMDDIGVNLYIPFRALPPDKVTPVPVSIEWGKRIENLDIVVDLGALAHVSGMVMFEDGRPAANMRVTVLGAESDQQSNTISADDGRFEIADAIPDQNIYISASGPTVASDPSGPLALVNGELNGVQLTVVECTASIWGQVILPDGTPAYAARVTARPLDSRAGATLRNEMVGRQGRFEIRNLKEGTYAIDVGASGWNAGAHYNSQPNCAEVTVENGQSISGVDIVFTAGFSRPQEGFIKNNNSPK